MTKKEKTISVKTKILELCQRYFDKQSKRNK